MKELNEVLEGATAAIEQGFFKLPIYGGPAVYRERVYCYELYHQMRLKWREIDTPFSLNGEVDKQSHFLLHDLGVKGQKPDLLVHIPGSMKGNFAIFEVKNVEAALDDPKKDFETLALFLTQVGYTRAIYLVYGEGNPDRIVKRMQGVAAKVENAKGIELWLHLEVGVSAFHAATFA